MAMLEQTIKIENSCNLIGKSKDVFSPIKEAITNSLDSIVAKQQQDSENDFTPTIDVTVYFLTNENLYGEDEPSLDFITIEDNGIGFTSENLARFKELASYTKGLNNRGTGKIQIFCRFDEVAINSTYYEENKLYNLSAVWKKNGEYDQNIIEVESPGNAKTIVTLSGFSGDIKEHGFFLRYFENIDELKRDVLKHFLLRLWLGNNNNKQLNLTIMNTVNGTQKEKYSFGHENIPKPDREEAIEVFTQKAQFIVDPKDKSKVNIEWEAVEPKYEILIHRFKMPRDRMDENAVFLCSKNIMVESFYFPAIKKKDSVFDGYRYLSSVSGDVFDIPEHVSQTVDKFVFPSKKDEEKRLRDGIQSLFNPEDKYIFWDDIKSKINDGLTSIYGDVKELKDRRTHDIAEKAKKYGISLEDAEAAPIAFNDTEEEVTEKLFQAQAKRFAKDSMEIEKTYQEIKDLKTKDLDPTSTQYITRLSELSSKLLEMIPQQNKDELARYIIRRDMVVTLLKLALNNSLTLQKEWVEEKEKGRKVRQDNEGIIHDIIFKRRMKGTPNDLWILNEEFVHFDGYSDIEIEKLEINGESLLENNEDVNAILTSMKTQRKAYLRQRPDIFIFPEEGKCVLVELKAPDVEVSAHLDQIQKYARLIANFARKPFHQFYGFLIGETIDRLSIPDRYTKVPRGNYWFYPYEPIKAVDESERVLAGLYQEVIPLSEIANRAEIRNRSFAQKLGLVDEDLKIIRDK
jgi:hypothetical protein